MIGSLQDNSLENTIANEISCWRRAFLALVIFCCFAFSVFAQNVKFSVSTDKDSYYEGEPIYLIYSIENADYQGLKYPVLPDFDILGQSTSQSTNMSSINGKTTRNVEYKINFQIRPKRKGVLTIPEASFVHQNKVYKSPAFNIEVKGVNVSENQSSKDRFIKVEVSNKSPMVGEPFTVTYTLFTVDQISDGGQIKTQASFQNFGSFTSKELSRFSASAMVINGKKFTVLEMQKHLLMPIKPGEVIVEGFDFEYVSYQYKQIGFFTQRTGEVPHVVKSPSFKVNVKALPNPPVHFSGLVGTFKLTKSIDKKELPVNDALTVKYQLSGKGNFDILQDLKLKWSNNWEVFEPKRQDEVKVSAAGHQGKLSFEYVAIPRTNGKQEVPALEITYFDLASNKYKSLKVGVDEIDVTGTSQNGNQGGVTTLGKQKVEKNGEDIRYLDVEQKSPRFEKTKSPVLFPVILSIACTSLAVYILGFYQVRKYSDTDLKNKRKKEANKKAEKILKSAYEVIDNDGEFYAKIQESLNQFLMDKLVLTQNELTKTSIEEKLAEMKVAELLQKDVLEVYSDCAMARYASVGVSKQELYDKVKVVVSSLV